MNPPEFLTAQNISKRFGITQALDQVSVSFRQGEVHALMGENGAGKSTLGKTIAGLYLQDQGTVTLDGRVLTPGDIDQSFDAGVRLVHQELAQCPNLSVAENLSLHQMPASRAGFVDFRAMRDRAARLVHALDKGIDVEAPLGLLSPGRRQICQIAAALDEDESGGGSKAKVIVLDEPTSSLSVAEADRLLEITRHLASLGITIIYVSHRMGEIFQVCDRVTVLRDGKFVATNIVKEIDEPTLVEQMIGRRLQTPARAAAGAEAQGKVILEVQGLSSPGRLANVSFSVRGGEVVGIGGLVGAGRSELLDAVFGLDHAAKGVVRCDGISLAGQGETPTHHQGTKLSISSGVGYVPEDRRRQGLFFELGIDENIVMPFMTHLASALGLRARPRERALVRDKMTEFRVKAASPASKPGELSGGNQQKLLIARWLGKDTRLLLLDEPTRGIDIGTKSEVYRLVREAADRGLAVVLVSSEMPELLALSDRVLVMASGKLQGELKGDDATQTNILRLATGTIPQRKAAASV